MVLQILPLVKAYQFSVYRYEYLKPPVFLRLGDERLAELDSANHTSDSAHVPWVVLWFLSEFATKKRKTWTEKHVLEYSEYSSTRDVGCIKGSLSIHPWLYA